MKILIDMGHPKHVHTFKNFIEKLESNGHVVKITATDKENITAVLDNYGFIYDLKKYRKGMLSKAIGVFKNDLWLYKIAKKFQPDIFVGSPYAAQVSWFFRKPHIGLNDTEIATLAMRFVLPFTNAILVPSCFGLDLGPKQIKFNSYFELAYLHPNYFKPDPSVLEELGLTKHDKYILLRFSSLVSHHDIGVKGLDFRSEEEKLKFIKELEDYGRVFLVSEIKLDKGLEKYKVNVKQNSFFSFVSHAAMYIGDGASMAAEAAVLGVPSIYVSTSRRGYLDELENVYELAYTILHQEQALEKVIELLEDKNLKNDWQIKRKKMLNEKIDTTKFMVEFIEEYYEKNFECDDFHGDK